MTGKIGIWIVLIWGITSLLLFLNSRHFVHKTFEKQVSENLTKENKVLQLYKTYKNEFILSLQGLYLSYDGSLTILSFPNVSLSTTPIFTNLSLNTHNPNKVATEQTNILNIIAQSDNHLSNVLNLKDLPMLLDISYINISNRQNTTTSMSTTNTTITTTTATTNILRETLIILTICNQLEMTLITLKYLKHSLNAADLLIVDDHRYIYTYVFHTA